MDLKSKITQQLLHLRSTVTCPICLEILISPTTLLCSHSFCTICIQQCPEQICPMCKLNTFPKILELDSTLEGLSTCISKLTERIYQEQINMIELNKSLQMQVHNPTQIALNVKKLERKENLPEFQVDDIIQVRPRMWPGINKPGGVAKILSVHHDIGNNSTYYDIKYILDNILEHNIDECYLMKAENINSDIRPSRKRKPISLATNNIEQTNETRKSTSIGINETIILLHTTVDEEFWPKLHEFARIFNAKIVDRFDNDSSYSNNNKYSGEAVNCSVTHVIMSTDENYTVNKRTLKFMQAILRGKWIISLNWIIESLKSKKLLDHSKFEVKGLRQYSEEREYAPSRSRLSYVQNGCKCILFANIAVFVTGYFPSPKPSKACLEELLLDGGAVLVQSADELLQIVRPRVAVQELLYYEVRGKKQGGKNRPKIDNIPHSAPMKRVIICSDNDAKVKLMSAYEGIESWNNVCIVNSTWSLDCISSFYIEDPEAEQFKIV